jgi:hypothetical protein
VSSVGRYRGSHVEFTLNARLVEIEQQYESVARPDCGDTCVPDRFRVQMEFLDNNGEIMLLGSAVTFVDTQGSPQYTLYLAGKTQKIRRTMHLNCAFVYPAVMWRCAVIGRGKQQLQSRLRLQLLYARANAATGYGVIKTMALIIVPYSMVFGLRRR